MNDALPFSDASPATDVLATDLEPRMVELLREHCRSRASVRVSQLDLLKAKGSYDLVTALFVLHRLGAKARLGARRLARLVGPAGSLIVTEFAGPRGFIARANEPRWRGRDLVGRLLGRYFAIRPWREPLRSTDIGPCLTELARALSPAGHQDFAWRYRLSLAELFRRIRRRAYAPFFQAPDDLEQLRREFEPHFAREFPFVEVIRVHRFARMR